MNLYGFAGGDPVNHTDPFGLSSTDIIVQGQNAQATVDYLKENSETFKDWYNKLDAHHSLTLTIGDATQL